MQILSPARLLSLLFLGFGSILVLRPGIAAEPAARVVRAGKLLDVVAGQVRIDQVIVIRGDRIVAVGPAASTTVPAGAEVIDLSGYTVLPGLIDTHTHLTRNASVPPYNRLGISIPRFALQGAANARATLLAGVTTVRNLGAPEYSDIAIRDAIIDGDIPGPRVLASGPSLGMTGGHCDETLLAPQYDYKSLSAADGVDGVTLAVRRNIKFGADVIKYCGTGGVFSKGDTVGGQQYSVAEVTALIAEAHTHGRRVAVHAHGAEGIKIAIRAGVDTVEHASLIDDEGLALAKSHGTWLSMDIYNTEYTQSEGPKNGELEEFLRKDREIAEIQRQNFARAVRAGIKLTMGTDGGIYPHGDNAKQLAVMVRYGMSPLQALQAATVVGADALGLKGETGSLQAGLSADIVAVRADPLADIHAMEDVGFVMKGGRIYKRDGIATAP